MFISEIRNVCLPLGMETENNFLFFSVIVPVYNRPDEVRELLESLVAQSYTDFEVIIVEDGSNKTCETVVKFFQNKLAINYISKENSGQGFSRNEGFKQAKGEYFIIFDSDCLIPKNYLEIVNKRLQENRLDAYGGPDKAHPSFASLQKAISYSMTSPLTTGGIRGRKEQAETFHPRSFNMGLSREIFEKTGGFKITRMGEDIELSIRIEKAGFKTGLIPEAFVYHKRRTRLSEFLKQLHFFGRARINIGRFHPDEVKFVHWLPALFVILCLFYITLPFWMLPLFWLFTAFGILFCCLLFLDALRQAKSLKVASLSIVTSLVQLTGYGIGFLTEFFRKLFGRTTNSSVDA